MIAPLAALARWQHAAGEYWPYVCAAPFLGDHPLPTARRPRRAPVARWLVGMATALPAEARPAIFVDLPPAATLGATPDLADLGFHVVPVIQRWAAHPAVLDCRALVDRLVLYAALIHRPVSERGVVFLLDGDREGPDRRPDFAPRVFDNRYTYSSDRFPPPTFLRARRIESLSWVGPSDIAQDLRPYLEDLGASLSLTPTVVGPGSRTD